MIDVGRAVLAGGARDRAVKKNKKNLGRRLDRNAGRVPECHCPGAPREATPLPF